MHGMCLPVWRESNSIWGWTILPNLLVKDSQDYWAHLLVTMISNWRQQTRINMTKKGKAQWNQNCTWRARYRASHKTLQSLKVCILLVWWHSATLECISAQWKNVKRHFVLCICLWNFVFVFVVNKMTKSAASERALVQCIILWLAPWGVNGHWAQMRTRTEHNNYKL